MKNSNKFILYASFCLAVFFAFFVTRNFLLRLILSICLCYWVYIKFNEEESPQSQEEFIYPIDSEHENGIFGYIYLLTYNNSKINHEHINSNIQKIIDITNKIIAVNNDSGVDKKIMRDLKSFYLPSLVKILVEYITLRANHPEDELLRDFEARVIHFTDEIVKCFSKQLSAALDDNLFEADIEMRHVMNQLRANGFMEDI